MEVPKKDLTTGVAKRQHGTLPRYEVQLEAHEELWAASGSVERQEASILRWELCRYVGDKSGASKVAVAVKVGGGDALWGWCDAFWGVGIRRGEAIDSPESNDVIITGSREDEISVECDAGTWSAVVDRTSKHTLTSLRYRCAVQRSRNVDNGSDGD